jgi:hypothetical protein
MAPDEVGDIAHEHQGMSRRIQQRLDTCIDCICAERAV